MRISQMDDIRPGRHYEEPLERISLLVPENVKGRLEEIANQQGVSVCAVVRAAINKCFGVKKQTGVRAKECAETKSQPRWPT